MAILLPAPWRAALKPLVAHFGGLPAKFRRKRIWGELQATIALLLWLRPLVKTSLKEACEAFSDFFAEQFGHGDINHDPAGLQRAIGKVPADQLIRLQQKLRATAEATRPRVPRWMTRLPWQLLAVDGTTFSTTRSPAITRHFPTIKDRSGRELSPHPLTRFVVAWDVVRHLPVTWWLSSIRSGERMSFLSMLQKITTPSLFLFDRGFPSRALLTALLARGHHFVFRMVATDAAAWPEVQRFLASKKRSAWVTFTIGRGKQVSTIRLRLIRRVFRRGRPCKGQKREVMVLLTDLPASRISDRHVIQLYARRWVVETAYREMKCFRDKGSRWRSSTKDGIERELLAVMIWYTLTAMVTGPLTNGQVQDAHDTGRRANTCCLLRAALVLLRVLVARRARKRLIEDLQRHIHSILRWMQKRRPGRTSPRVKLVIPHPYARS